MDKLKVGNSYTATVDGDAWETSILHIVEGTPLVSIHREIKGHGKTTIDQLIFLPGQELDWLIETLSEARDRFNAQAPGDDKIDSMEGLLKLRRSISIGKGNSDD